MYSELIRKNDEHWRDNLIGLSLNKRLEKAIHQRAQLETLQYLIEHSKNKKPFMPRMHETVFVTATNKKGKILDIGLNKPNDLILDNFGYTLAGLIRQPSLGITSNNLPDINNVSRSVAAMSNGSGFNCSSANLGSNIQLGSSTTPAARNDYKIGTALGSAPENTYFPTNSGSYSGGFISFAGAVTAGGSGTVNEVLLIGQWAAPAAQQFALFHDILGVGVAYVATNPLTASYSISL